MTDFEIENELKSNLGAGEKFIWTGKPKGDCCSGATMHFLIPFSLVWCGFAVFWETSVLSTGAPLSFPLFGIIFVVAGLYMVIGRFFIDAKKRANTIYAITPDRIIIRTGVFSMETKSLNIRTLSDITIIEKPDHSGTITLGPVDPRYARMQGVEWPGMKQPPRLELIDDVKVFMIKLLNCNGRNNNRQKSQTININNLARMRDPERIKVTLDKLETLWKKHPDFRLGQLIMVIAKTEEHNPKLFYLEDDAFLKLLEERLSGN